MTTTNQPNHSLSILLISLNHDCQWIVCSHHHTLATWGLHTDDAPLTAQQPSPMDYKPQLQQTQNHNNIQETKKL